MNRLWISSALALVLLAGCEDDETIIVPTDTSPPAAPRGVVSVTGDGEVFLNWLPNTEPDVAGYRVYKGTCPDGPSCPYDRVAITTGTAFAVGGLVNGSTRYFAVAAYDRAGNESPLSYENISDTPRPEGFGQVLTDDIDGPATAGYDFSAYRSRPWDDLLTDIYFTSDGALRMIAPFTDTELQDAGFANTLDAVDFAPTAGWSPTGTVELIAGHCYVVQLRQPSPSTARNYAKFRVVSVSGSAVVFDWAYQIAVNNRELKAQPVREATPRVRRAVS